MLTAQQFPYPNPQVVPLADQDRDRILARLRKECGGCRMAEGRDDYAVILTGGTSDEHPPVVITQKNHKEIDNALLNAMQRGVFNGKSSIKCSRRSSSPFSTKSRNFSLFVG